MSLRKPPVRDETGDADGRGRDRLRGNDCRDRPGETVRRSCRDRGEPQRHRHEQEERAHVVAPTQDDRHPADVLEALHERKQRADEKRRLEVALVQQRVGCGSERKQDERRRDPTDELDAERAREQAAKSSPVLPRHVAKAELDQRLLDRQVEQALEEPGGGENERVAAERVPGEQMGGDDGAEEAEGCGGVDPGGGCRTAPEEPRAHERAILRRA